MRTMLSCFGSIFLVLAVLSQITGSKDSLQLWTIAAVFLSALAICDYLAHVRHALEYLATEKGKEVRRRRDDDDDDD